MPILSANRIGGVLKDIHETDEDRSYFITRLFIHEAVNKDVNERSLSEVNEKNERSLSEVLSEVLKASDFSKLEKLIKFIEETYNSYDTFLVGTANSSLENITFYTRLGYVYSHRIENFFIDYYPNKIIENGMQATDLMYFKKSRQGLN